MCACGVFKGMGVRKGGWGWGGESVACAQQDQENKKVLSMCVYVSTRIYALPKCVHWNL